MPRQARRSIGLTLVLLTTRLRRPPLAHWGIRAWRATDVRMLLPYGDGSNGSTGSDS